MCSELVEALEPSHKISVCRELGSNCLPGGMLAPSSWSISKQKVVPGDSGGAFPSSVKQLEGSVLN